MRSLSPQTPPLPEPPRRWRGVAEPPLGCLTSHEIEAAKYEMLRHRGFGTSLGPCAIWCFVCSEPSPCSGLARAVDALATAHGARPRGAP